MITYMNKVLDYEVPILVPENSQEYNSLDPSRPDAANDDACKYTILHGWNSEAREIIVSVLETLTGVKREMKPGALKKDGTPGAEVPAETPATYKVRALGLANKSHEETVDEVKKALAPLKFDPSPGERSGGAGRIGKEFYGIADGIIEKGPEAVSKAVRKLKKLNPGLEIKMLEDNTVDRDSLAQAARVNYLRKLAESRDEILA